MTSRQMEMTDTRPCTCAPDERPYPCQHKYALGLCRKAEIRSLRIELDRCIAQIADLTKIRLEDELVHGNVMGRIAIALFGDQNNRTDEDCVARAAEIGYQLTGTQEALFQAQEAAKMLASEVAALRDQEEFNETALKGYRNNIDDLKHDIDRHVQIAAEQAQEIEELRSDLAAARELERMWYDRYYALWVHVMPLLKLGAMHPYQKWAEEVNDQYRIDAAIAGEKK